MEQALRIVKNYIPRRIFLLFQPAYHFMLAFLAALVYGFPSRRLMVIGVTGTKGKTTVVELIHALLSENGSKVASLSSLRMKIGDYEERNERKMTMPGRLSLQWFLRKAVRSGCRYAALEVTSEGVKQFRHRFINFDVAVMTNVSPEHIESHGSFERYLRAKLDLFWRLRTADLAIINHDDPQWQRFSASTAAHKSWYGKDSIDAGGATWQIRDRAVTERGIAFELGGTTFSSGLRGEFNFYNILAALAFGLSQYIPPEKVASAVAKILVIPGRMEFIQQEPFAVVVDYAHTPDSLRTVYATLKRSKGQEAKMVCVLGSAGGGRDKWKRPELGKIAAEFCSEVILTDEDPYDDDPEGIIHDIAEGVLLHSPSGRAQLKKILDRRDAIREALRLASAGDTVIITGKGAEPWIVGSNGTKIPWDDRKVAREELGKREHKTAS